MMKRSTTQLRLFLVVLITSLSTWQAKANEFPTIYQDSPCETVGEWTKITTKDGISISYSTISCNDESFLAIKFENQNAEARDFVWSITQNNELQIVADDGLFEEIVRLGANETHVFKGLYLISIDKENDYSNLDVTIKPYKN